MSDDSGPDPDAGSDSPVSAAAMSEVRDDVRSMGTRREPDRPPEDAIGRKEDFIIQRDEQQNVIPVWERIPGTEKFALVHPLSNGEADRRLPESGNATDMEDDNLLEFIQEKIIEPDLGDAESLDDIVAFGVEPLVMCIYNASGLQMSSGLISENSDMMELMQAVEGNSSGGSSGRPPTGSS